MQTMNDAFLEAFRAYQGSGGKQTFDEWSHVIPATSDEQATERERQTRNASTSKPAKAHSKKQAKANGKHRPTQDAMVDLAAQHVAEEKKIHGQVRAAIRAFESSATKKQAALMVAKYFGEGTVRGMTKPLWRARYESQREAVAAMWGVPLDADHKPLLDAKVQTMVRLRADGYKALGVTPPVKTNGGAPKTPVVDRAMTSSRRFLVEMSPDQRLAFLAKVKAAIKEMNTAAVGKAAA